MADSYEKDPVDARDLGIQKPLTIFLSAGPNPDFGQNRRNYRKPSRDVQAQTFAEAREAARLYRDEFALGGGNWTGGDILDKRGKKVAHISYNLRIWTPEPWPESHEIAVDLDGATLVTSRRKI